jgi:hypothetical protein
MRQFFSFWWPCVKYAARGSAAFANDWQWLFGIPIVAGIIRYISVSHGKQGLSTESPIADGVIFAAGAFLVTWLIGFVIRLLHAPVVKNAEAKAIENRLRDQLKLVESTRALLEIQFESKRPYQRTQDGCDAQWYFHLFNHGPAIAENVLVKLTKFSPEPNAELWKRIHLPYSVLPAHMTADMGGIRINPGHHEIFKVVRCVPSGTGAYVVWQFGQPANQHDQQFQMENHEQWALSYRVTAANSDEINFVLVIFIQDNKLVVEKQ